MPKELVDDGSSYPASVTCPVESDPLTLTPIENGRQDLANRTAYLKAKIDSVLSSGLSGVDTVATFATVADLRASLVHRDGGIAVILSIPRAYYWKSASASADDGEWVVQPTDVVGNGRWTADKPAIRQVAFGSADSGAGDTTITAGATFVDVATFSLSLTDDSNVDLFASLQATKSVSADTLELRIAVTRPDTSVVAVGQLYEGAITNTRQSVSIVRHYAPTQSGTHVIRLQARSDPSNATVHKGAVVIGRSYRT